MKEKLSTLLILSIFLFLNFEVHGQESKWSVGIQAGRTQLSGFTRIIYEPIPEFEAQGMGGVNIQVFGRYNIYKKVSVFASGGINNLVSGTRFQGERGSNFGTSGVTSQFFAGIDYDIPFGNSGFGILSKLAFGLTGSNAWGKNLERYTSENEGFPVIGTIQVHPLTGEQKDALVYVKDVQISATENKFIYHIRPELGFTKSTTDTNFLFRLFTDLLQAGIFILKIFTT